MAFLSKFRLRQDPPPPARIKPLNRFYRFFGLQAGDPFDHDRSVSSPYIRPVCLGLIRLLFGTYMLISFIVYFSLLAAQKNKFLRKRAWKLFGDIMFHSFLGIAAYFLVSGYHTLEYVRKKRNPLSLWNRQFQLAHSFLQTTILTFPLFCTIIYLYWTLPALPAWHTRAQSLWSTITFYMLNTFFSFTELFLSASRPRPWTHLIVVILILGLYLAFHSILVAASGGKVWVYTVLKFSLVINRGWISAVRAFGLCFLVTVTFSVMQLLLWLKCRYLRGLKLPQPSVDGIELRKVEYLQPSGDSSQEINV
jgi:hypothetical protein